MAEKRIPALLGVRTQVRFLSCEPLLGPIDLSRWLGYYPLDETENDRGSGVPGSQGRSTPNRPSGSCLEDRLTLWGQMEKEQGQGITTSSQKGRERRGRIPSSTHDVRGQEGARAGPQTNLSAFHGTDSARAHRESQEREEEGQQAVQPRTQDTLWTDATHDRRAQERTCSASERREECNGKTHGEGREGNTASAQCRRETQVDSSRLRSDRPHGVEDRARAPMGISWIICGGESGHHARTMRPEWASSVRDQARRGGIAFFFKQTGACLAKDWKIKPPGTDPLEWPAEFRTQEIPTPLYYSMPDVAERRA